MDSTTMKWLCSSGKQEDFATWSTRSSLVFKRKIFSKHWLAQQWNQSNPQLWGTLRRMSRERLIELQQRNLNNKKFRDDKNTLWCMLALPHDSRSLMLIRHDCVNKDGLGEGTRPWNLLNERFRSAELPTVVALVCLIVRM